MLKLIHRRRQEGEHARHVIATRPPQYPVKDIEKVKMLIKFMTIDTLIYADKLNDPDTPTTEQRRDTRKKMIETAIAGISTNKELTKRMSALSALEKDNIVQSTIVWADFHRALTTTSNEERKAIYNSHWDSYIYKATHNTVVFQGALENKDEIETIMVDYYDNVINNDENYNKFIGTEDIVEKRRILAENIDISYAAVLSFNENSTGANSVKGVLFSEPLPEKIHEIAKQ